MSRDYHREIGFPDVSFPTGSFDVEASDHAQAESNKDKYGGFALPTRIKLTEAMYERDPKAVTGSAEGEKTLPHVFEVTTESGEVVKIGARTHYDDRRDIILIIRPHDNLIVTAWINIKGDSHDTLDTTQYERP
jgi:hypothetical protein